MRQLFLSAIAVVCSFWSIAQTSNKNKFDTLKLSGVSYTVYKDWRTQLSKKYELDSAGASDMNQKLIFARTNNGMVYSVRNKLTTK